MNLSEILLGRRLASTEFQQQLIGPIIGVSILGLDAFSSAAYGPEAALTILIPYGIENLHYIIPIMIAVMLLLSIVFISYRQTISGYPQGGGSYTVAKENLGGLYGLIAAAGLCIDYVLNVAVAISAGIGAFVSALPIFNQHTVILSLLVLSILSIVNLRGVREAGVLFIIPTYIFLVSITFAIAIGLYHIVISNGNPIAVEKHFYPPAATETIGLWVLLKAFANGCSAMTGVEAVSNGVTLFKEPNVKNAKTTLSIIVISLVFFLIGISLLSFYYRIGATVEGEPGYQSILSQIFAAIYGRNIAYYLSVFSVILVLILSANTSFAGFPRVCKLLATDHYLPEIFSRRGRRLVYSGGIYVLAICSATLLIIFEGKTNLLIPLFAIGAFIAFTCSQAGMVVHWLNKRSEHGVYHSMVLNFVGAVCTLVTLVIVFFSKFLSGAWLVLFVIPVIVWMLGLEKRYNDKIARQVYLSGSTDFSNLQSPIVIVPIHNWDRLAEKGLKLAITISNDVRVVQVITDSDIQIALKHKWSDLVEKPAHKANKPVPKLILLRSQYRDFVETVLSYTKSVKDENPDKEIAIIVPQLIEPHWYHLIFRNEAMFLESALLWKGGPKVIVISTPWYLT